MPDHLADTAMSSNQDQPLWFRVEPPLWWRVAKMHVIADRHLADGTRQHMVLEPCQPGLVVNNAQVVSQASCPDAVFSPVLSHLSESQ